MTSPPPSTARPIDGRAIAASLRGRIADHAAQLAAARGLTPGLAAVLVGDDAASQIYVRAKEKALLEAGLRVAAHRLPADTSISDLLDLIGMLNADPAIHGILVQLPLPAQLPPAAVIAAIDPAKDVDGLTPASVGLLWAGQPGLFPCTPVGCQLLLRHALGSLEGLQAVVLGRSLLVGRPMAALLMREDCTVSVAHASSRDTDVLCREADIIVAATGRAGLVRGSWIKPGATVIDVGISRVVDASGTARIVGDVAYDEAIQVAGAITPVPGGVGPMTIACLLRNVLLAACRSAGLEDPDV